MSSTLTYPTNTTTYTDYSGWINITLSDVNGSATCSLNDSRWTEQTTPPYGNETVAFYNSDVDTSGNYSFSLGCNDSSHIVNTTFWFYIEPWKINASDRYNSSAISNFSADISGRGAYNTTDGLLETDIPLNYADTFNVTLSAADYFNRTYADQSPNETLQGVLWQYQLNLFVRDILTNTSISSFDVNTSQASYNGTAGAQTLYLTAATHLINISSDNYYPDPYELNITGTAQTIENRTIYLRPYINISIRTEKTDEPFNTSLTQQTKVYFYCPEATIEQTFNTTANENSIYIPVNCTWDFIKLDVTYNDTSYFRTLIPDYDERDITFYMLDLTEDLGVQIILRLNDLVGDYDDGKILISRPISGTERYMIQQLWDMEAKTTLYLLKDAYYTVKIVNNDGTLIRTLGSLIADAAEEKIITVPELDFVPDKAIGGNITWEWQDTSTTIRLIYNDTLLSTTSLIFSVYYAENLSLAYQTTETDLGAASFTYMAGNASFLACFNTSNPTVEYVIDECHTFLGTRDSALGDWTGWDTDDLALYLTWFCTFIVVAALLLFAPAPEWALALSDVLMWLFMKIGWLTYGSSITDGMILMIIGLLAALAFIGRVFIR